MQQQQNAVHDRAYTVWNMVDRRPCDAVISGKIKITFLLYEKIISSISNVIYLTDSRTTLHQTEWDCMIHIFQFSRHNSHSRRNTRPCKDTIISV